jgi:prepilin-type N-terminal cleavage/methylation domain-containing protein
MGKTGQNWTGYVLEPKNRQGGFTLVEMMIVSAIIGITTMIAVPSYLQWHTRYQLREATLEINSQLNLARMAAMNRNMAVRSTLALTAGNVTMITTNTTGTVVVLSPVTFPASVTGARDAATLDTDPAPPPVNILFTSLGLLQGTGSSPLPVRVMNNNGLTYSVAVTGGGKVSWCAKATCP